MVKRIIKLPEGVWAFDDKKPLGKPGGFGEVFLGASPTKDVAIKRLKVTAQEAAHRELKIGQALKGGAFEHIVPVLDAGQDAESNRYYIVMPICGQSLQDVIDGQGYEFSVEFSRGVIISILRGLLEVAHITHRDLKPSNILVHNSNWKIADFGIAKFVEDSTSLETLRSSLTPAYAAPEQWRGERPTSETDVYALGCIAFALATGAPPFEGSIEEIREGHLHLPPAVLGQHPPQVNQFVAQMLRKVPAARPTLKRCLEVFDGIQLETKADSGARRALAHVAQEVAAQVAAAEALQQRADNRRKERAALFVDARAELDRLRAELFRQVQSVSENADIGGGC